MKDIAVSTLHAMPQMPSCISAAENEVQQEPGIDYLHGPWVPSQTTESDMSPGPWARQAGMDSKGARLTLASWT